MITRKLGKLIRGKATPFQFMAASILGALLGFAPDFAQAPALIALLAAALLIVNANLGFALLVAGGARLLSLVCVSLSFQIGRFLLDGPTAGLAEAIVNAPVLAWCGLEYYAVAGGQLLGLAVGIVVGLLVTRALTGFRRRMAAAEGNSTRMRDLTSKPWARFAIWLFLGSKGKESWEQKLQKRVGNPVRVWGAALVVVLVVGAWFLQQTLAGPLARRGLQSGLESANGATVDVGGVDLDLAGGKLAVSALALADPNALQRDLFRAQHLEADVDEGDLLRKRFHVARLVVSGARSGARRDTPGERIAPRVEEQPESTERTFPDPRDYSLEQVLTEYETWKERLTQTRRWIDRLAGSEASAAEGEEAEEALADRLARRVAEQGWFGVRADHLVDGAPTLRLSELAIADFETSYSPGRTFDLRASELSTQPHLVDAPPRVELASRDGALGLAVDLAPVSRAGGDGALRFHWKGLAVDDVMAQLKIPGGAPFRGGTLDVEIDGAWDHGRIGEVDLPLRVTLRDTTLQMQGIQPTPLERLELPIELKGPIDAPRIRFDTATLTDALVAAGKERLAREVQGVVNEKVDELKQEAEDQLQDKLKGELDKQLPGAKGALKGLLGDG